MPHFKKTPWQERVVTIQNANGASFWLKEAIASSMRRDCLDAYRDAATLAEILKSRLDQILRQEA